MRSKGHSYACSLIPCFFFFRLRAVWIDREECLEPLRCVRTPTDLAFAFLSEPPVPFCLGGFGQAGVPLWYVVASVEDPLLFELSSLTHHLFLSWCPNNRPRICHFQARFEPSADITLIIDILTGGAGALWTALPSQRAVAAPRLLGVPWACAPCCFHSASPLHCTQGEEEDGLERPVRHVGRPAAQVLRAVPEEQGAIVRQIGLQFCSPAAFVMMRAAPPHQLASHPPIYR